MDEEANTRRLAYEDHRDALQFEHALINRKVTWLLTSQTLLFAALGLMLDAESITLLRIIAGVGLAISITIAFALWGNMAAKRYVHSDYVDYLQSVRQRSWPPPRGEQMYTALGAPKANRFEFGVRTWTTYHSMAMDLLVPLIFIVGWVLVLINGENIVEAASSSGR